ncbi:hypothetical protein DN070_22135 [Pseudomonas aeruginosa]|uniref:hypothetical protein n=1 Tax=Pseudomonas aeruginosa TaxID=287 RepID=UPI000DE94DBC|nr:hypothetical protein [Pseudomonas aeruginosa]RCH58826.1 hypothetical protein DN070_22135 [Pseudomonas aeruginosa]
MPSFMAPSVGKLFVASAVTGVPARARPRPSAIILLLVVHMAIGLSLFGISSVAMAWPAWSPDYCWA